MKWFNLSLKVLAGLAVAAGSLVTAGVLPIFVAPIAAAVGGLAGYLHTQPELNK